MMPKTRVPGYLVGMDLGFTEMAEGRYVNDSGVITDFVFESYKKDLVAILGAHKDIHFYRVHPDGFNLKDVVPLWER